MFSVIFRGRENAHVDEGFKLIEKLTAELEPVSKLEQRPTMHGRRIVAIYRAEVTLARRAMSS